MNKENDILIVKELIEIDEGKHKGTIVDVTREHRGDKQQYDYTDIHVTVDGVHNEHEELKPIKFGFPTNLSVATGLGKFLDKAGFEIIAGANISFADIQKVLIGKQISFLTQNEEGKDGGIFARILNDTIKFR